MCHFFEKTVENKRSLGEKGVKNGEKMKIFKHFTFCNIFRSGRI
jgi:hypothetical protein